MSPSTQAVAAVVSKPDAMARKLNLKIRDELKQMPDLTVHLIGQRLLNRAEIRFLYRHIIRIPDYPEIESFMVMAPVEILRVSGPEAGERMEKFKKEFRERHKLPVPFFPDLKPESQNLVHACSDPRELAILLRPIR
jgi:hypothetical protein